MYFTTRIDQLTDQPTKPNQPTVGFLHIMFTTSLLSTTHLPQPVHETEKRFAYRAAVALASPVHDGSRFIQRLFLFYHYYHNPTHISPPHFDSRNLGNPPSRLTHHYHHRHHL
ncbi:hypothetical protein QCA50_003752 [Cerrena zonata]|uniref:Uncharacterized protein n=1 Tax=Cerrena zonata TaxID=2478898 RepID=A0AAW0GPG9_9APHY